MPDLNVVIGADLSQYRAGMTQAGAIAAGTSSEITRDLGQAAQATTALGGSAMSTSMRFMQMRSGISAARDGVMAFTLGGQAADRSLMAMGHHINSLVNETGSFKGAMTALGQSLWGPGGIILGITVAYELYKHFAKQTHEAASESKAYADTLEAVASARLKGQEAGEKETTRLKILYDATQNHALSLKSRNEAYDELESKYPKFFSNAEREQTLLGQNSAAYLALATAILAAASAKAYEERIGENAIKQRDNENRITDIQIAKEKAMQGLVTARNNAKQPSTSGGAGGSSGAGYAQIQAGFEKEITDLTAEQTHYRVENNKLAKENQQLSKLATDSESQAGFKTEQQIDEKNKKIKEGFAIQEALIADLKIKLENAIVNDKPTIAHQLSLDLDAANAKLDLMKAKFENASFVGGGSLNQLNPTLTRLTGNDLPSGLTNNPEKDLVTVKAGAKAFQENSNAIYNSQLALDRYKKELLATDNVVKLFGSGLTQAFQGALSGTQSFFSAMSQFLVQLIEKLIAAALAAAVLAALLSATGFGAGTSFTSIFGQLSGLTGIFGGTSAGKSLGGGIAAHADGGIFTSARVGMFAEAGPEAIVTPKHLADFAGVNTSKGNDTDVIVGKLNGSTLELWKLRSAKQKSRTS